METQEEYTIALDNPPASSPFPALGIQIQDGFANLVISFGPGTHIIQSVTEQQMNHICHQWLGRHSKKDTH